MHEEEETEIMVVEPGDRLTMSNAHELLKLIKSISDSRTPMIIVNMERTTIIDSTGIGTLVGAMKYVRQLKGGFALSRLSPEIQRMFQLMNLHEVFELFESVELAAQHLTSHITK